MTPQYPTGMTQRVAQTRPDPNQEQGHQRPKGGHGLHHPQADPFPQPREEQLTIAPNQNIKPKPALNQLSDISSLPITSQMQKKRPHPRQWDPHKIHQKNKITSHQILTRKTQTEMSSSRRVEAPIKAAPTTAPITTIRNRLTRAKARNKARTTPAQTTQNKSRVTNPTTTVACQEKPGVEPQ